MTPYARQANWGTVGKDCAAFGCAARKTILGGIVAGAVFAVYQMGIAWLLKGNPIEPLRMVAGISGKSTTQPWYPLSAAVPIALAIHMILSVIFALAFVLLLGYIPWSIDTRARFITAAGVYSVFLWLMNFYVIAPLFGWTWFIYSLNPFLQGFIGHLFFYGIVLGAYLQSDRRRYKRE